MVTGKVRRARVVAAPTVLRLRRAGVTAVAALIVPREVELVATKVARQLASKAVKVTTLAPQEVPVSRVSQGLGMVDVT